MKVSRYHLLNYRFASPYEDALRSNPLEDLSEEGFIPEFRMKKTEVHFLCDLSQNELQYNAKTIVNATFHWKERFCCR